MKFQEKEPLPSVEKKEEMVDGLFMEGRIPREPSHNEAITFIHGSGMNYLSGQPVIETFSSKDFGYPSFTFSLRGHTNSETPDDFTRRGLKMYQEDIRNISEHLEKQFGIKDDQRIIWGHSLGGLIGMQEAKLNSPHALILMNSGLPKQLLEEIGMENAYKGDTPEEMEKLRELIKRGEINIKDPQKVRKYFANRLPADFDENYNAKYSKLLSQESNQVRLEISTDPPDIKPGEIKCPILVVYGTNDPAISVEHSRQLADYLRADHLETEMSHMGMFEEDWPKTAEQIDDWLKSLKEK